MIILYRYIYEPANRKPSNKSHINTINSNINKDIIDLSNNFHNIFDNSNNVFDYFDNSLHTPIEKTIDQLIDDLCSEFDEILIALQNLKY